MIGILVGSIVTILILMLATFEWHRLSPRRAMRNASSLQPLRVRIPTIRKTGMPTEGVQEFGLAAEFFSILSGIQAPFAIEIAVPHVGAKASCFVVVPRNAARFAKAAIQKFWPSAEILPMNDRSVLNPHGAVAATTLRKKHREREIHTYATLTTNTCRPIIDAFNGINSVGEGLALQVLIQPTSSGSRRSIPKQTSRTGTHQPLFHANIRLVASAPSPLRATELLDRLSSAFKHFTTPEGQTLHATQTRAPEKMVNHFLARTFVEQETTIVTGAELVSIIHLPTCAMEV